MRFIYEIFFWNLSLWRFWFAGSIRKQLDAFLQGFYEIIPKHLISMFNEQELELLISGLPTVDIDDLCANTEYKTYTKTSPQVGKIEHVLFSPKMNEKYS